MARPWPGGLSRAAVYRLVALGLVLLLLPASVLVRPAPPPGVRPLPTASLRGLPAPAQAFISRTLGEDIPAYRIHGRRAANPAQGLAIRFTSAGPVVRTAGERLTLRVAGRAAAPVATANRVDYRRGPLTEWYVNGPLGLEQGFTLTRPAAVRMHVGGTLAPRLSGNAVTLRAGAAVLQLRGLVAYDADHRPLAARFDLRGRTLTLRVDSGGARYPVTIDPFLQQTKLTPPGGGSSVAVSGDTVVVGSPQAAVGQDGAGAAYVFVKPAAGWDDLTAAARLAASDGVSFDQLGRSVAISGDTIVAGAANIASNAPRSRGAAYVFVKPASGWADATETAKLTAGDGALNDRLGTTVAISGNTIAAAAPDAAVGGQTTAGALYVFTKPGGGWATTTQTAKLVASDAASADGLGRALALSGDTVVAGAPASDPNGVFSAGAAYVFVKPGGGWADATETAKLTASDRNTGDLLGTAVAIAGDTIAAGAPFSDPGGASAAGAAYVFLKPGGGWTSTIQTAKLVPHDPVSSGMFGSSMAVSDDIIVAGASNARPGGDVSRGAAYAFIKPAGGWADMTDSAVLTASDGASGDMFGGSAALDAGTLVVGASGGGIRPGAAYVFSAAATGPDLALPAEIVAEASGPSGAAVIYTATATDAADPSPTVSCTPAPGSVFPLGRTTVRCTATSTSGQTSGPFHVTIRDTTPPAIAMPANVAVSTNLPSGTVATYAAPTATDLVDGSVTPACASSPSAGLASGSTFPIGTTTITCTAHDARGNTASASFTVVDTLLPDTTAPTLSVPANMTIDASGPAGVVVSYTATATDPDNTAEQIPLTCAPGSGTTFALAAGAKTKATTVTCSATDPQGNTGTMSFTVKVLGARDQLANLRKRVGAAPKKLRSALQKKLSDADREITKHPAKAKTLLSGFIAKVKAGKPRPTVAQRTRWVTDATRIIHVLR